MRLDYKLNPKRVVAQETAEITQKAPPPKRKRDAEDSLDAEENDTMGVPEADLDENELGHKKKRIRLDEDDTEEEDEKMNVDTNANGPPAPRPGGTPSVAERTGLHPVKTNSHSDLSSFRRTNSFGAPPSRPKAGSNIKRK